jgi:hypothetical protein
VLTYWQLPPLSSNYTTEVDYPWSLYFTFNYNTDAYFEEIECIWEYWPADSFFDIRISLDDTVVVEHLNISDGGPIIVTTDPTWSYGQYLIEIRQGSWASWGNGTIVWHHMPRMGSTYWHPDHIDVGELRAADSNEWDYLDEHWYHVNVDDAMEHVFQFGQNAPFIGIANWTAELYNMTHPGVILRSTEGYYVTDEWPRYLVLPSLGDPDYSDMHEYIIRLRYIGGGIGNVSLVTQPYEGRSMDDPLWHTILTDQPFNIMLPYTYTGPVEVYVNATVSPGTAYGIVFNTSSQFIYAEVWDGSGWVQITWDIYDGVAHWFSTEIMSLTDTLCMRFFPEMGEVMIYNIMTYEA